MSLEDLKRLVETLPERRGWDFSAVRDECDPVPWSYYEVARRYLSPLHRVLDIGTGGGEQFLALAEYYGSGVGIDDPEMVAIASFTAGGRLPRQVPGDGCGGARIPAESFDVVLTRHAPAIRRIARVLRPGGVFITQRVGARNHGNITALFGCGPGGQYATAWATVVAWAGVRRDGGRCAPAPNVPYF